MSGLFYCLIFLNSDIKGIIARRQFVIKMRQKLGITNTTFEMLREKFKRIFDEGKPKIAN